MRRACFAIASTTEGAPSAAKNGHKRNTESTPSRAASRVSGMDRSPRTASTPAGRAAAGSRTKARTPAPIPTNWDTTCLPTLPVAPVTRILPCSVINSPFSVGSDIFDLGSRAPVDPAVRRSCGSSVLRPGLLARTQCVTRKVRGRRTGGRYSARTSVQVWPVLPMLWLPSPSTASDEPAEC